MLKRLYVHNFRCFDNFEFSLQDETSVLLLGKNGSGKSTLRQVFKIFQSIGRGTSRLGDLVQPSDFAQRRTELPMSFELELNLGGHSYQYSLVLELPQTFRELRVAKECLTVDGKPFFSRERAEVSLRRGVKSRQDSVFSIDWHVIALPLIQDPSATSVLESFKRWLSSMVLLAPVPQDMSAETHSVLEAINERGSNLADWLAALLESYPAAYSVCVDYLQVVVPDFSSLRFERLGRDVRALLVSFGQGQGGLELPISALSDGEKCFFLSAVLLAANHVSGPLFTFWDEPDNFLAPDEVSQFVIALKRNFLRQGGQLIATSHNSETIMSFAEDACQVMVRRSHLEPTIIRNLGDLRGNPEMHQTLLQRLLDGSIGE